MAVNPVPSHFITDLVAVVALVVSAATGMTIPVQEQQAAQHLSAVFQAPVQIMQVAGADLLVVEP
jgi:hypothetical protein